MKHEVLIWSKNKETRKGFFIEHHLELSQEEIEKFAMEKYSEDYDLNDEREYWAELDKTTH